MIDLVPAWHKMVGNDNPAGMREPTDTWGEKATTTQISKGYRIKRLDNFFVHSRLGTMVILVGTIQLRCTTYTCKNKEQQNKLMQAIVNGSYTK